MTARSTELFAMRRGDRIEHFYPSTVAVRMCGPGTIVRVRVTDDPAGAHWAWWNAERRHHSFVYGFRDAVAMCFPYGPEAETARGRGEVVQVRVDVLRDATAEERR